MNIYPNPSKNTYLNIDVHFAQSAKEPIQWIIYDAFGKAPFSKGTIPVGMEKIELPLSNLSTGTYLLQLKQGKAQMVQSFIIIEK